MTQQQAPQAPQTPPAQAIPTPVCESLLAQKEWFAVYTIVRHEKKAATLLEKFRIETFLPCRTVRSQWKDRCVNVDLPLFAGYLFVHIPAEERFRILNTQGVVRILSSKGIPIPIPEYQIKAIRTLVESALVYEPVDYFPEGREVVVRNGPLRGVRGSVVAHRGSHRLILSADLIQQSVAVEIDVQDVELT